MNTRRIFIITTALAAIFAFSISAAAAQSGSGNTGTGGGNGGGYQGGRNADAPRGSSNGGGLYGSGLMVNLPPASVDALPEEVIDLMIDGWMDEQHAYAVYQAVLEQFGNIRPFSNIQTSEMQHISAWETLFERYGIAVPEVPSLDLPNFTSVTDACALGAAAEIANFDLYDAMLSTFEPYPDLLYVAQALRDASEFSHLPAFENCAG